MADVQLLQSTSNTSLIATVSATFTNAPTQGNLLIAVVTASVGVGSISLSNSGWSSGITIAVGASGGMVVFYKVAIAGSDTTVTANATLGTFMDLQIFEYDGIDNAVPLDKTASTADSGSGVTSRASGTTATLSQGIELAFAAVAMDGSNGGGASWTNSYNAEITTSHLITADLTTNATTAQSTTGSWTTSRRAAGVILTFYGETGDSYGLKIPIPAKTLTLNYGHPLAKYTVFSVPFFQRGGSGIYATDVFSKVNCMNINGSPGWTTDLYGPAFKFDGTTNDLGWPAGFTVTWQIFTILAVIYPTSITGARAMLGSNVNGGIEFRLNGANLNLLKQNLVDMGSSSGTVSINTWSVVGITYDANGKMNFYINGTNAGNATSVQTFSSFVPQIGENQNSGNEFFSGNMSLLHVFNQAFNDQAMRQLSANPWQIFTQSSFYKLFDNFTTPSGFISKAPQSISQPLNFDTAISV